ncbi:histidine phosphatase family protein [Egibacter rhizosphaerae]|uniref:Histidine phosphatase family protein n=1 Tax=Egibacter rhizosphaerae TaxID=1670831 RepID=A0A411YJB8_9ACTN|nr:histidine phosphatase family protein [Egibacter rhizosphaerae]QBI21394.1 histidine phosphatase family protein [Egibacter rhizosphaerae]
MSSRLVLLRHGETVATAADQPWCAGRRADPPLSARGRQQAEAARQRLPEPDVVARSPARRAAETAEPWAADARVLDGLAERDFGMWEGRPWSALWAEAPADATADPVAYAAFDPPAAEPLPVVADRAWAAARHLRDLAVRVANEPGDAGAGGTVLAVTHAGPIRCVLACALGLPLHRAFAFALPHGTAAVLTCHASAWNLHALGA